MKLALLVAIFIGSANAACPSNFVMSISIPGKCYHVEASLYANFFSTVNYCRNLIHGADILAIANGFENNEVTTLLNSSGLSLAWIGSAFYDNKTHWITTAAGNSSYSNWPSGTYDGQAAVIDSSGSWGCMDVSAGRRFICQIYPDDPTTFPPPQITCPSGWRPSISARGKCYMPINDTNFYSAIRNCETTEVGDSHAELVTIVSQLEMMELWPMYGKGSWVSMTNLEGDGAWHWVNTLHPTDYFGPNGPPSSGNCAYTTNFILNGTSCSASVPTFCQYFPGEPSTPPPPTTPSTPTPLPTFPGLNCPQNGIASLTEPKTCYYVLNGTEGFQSARSACQALNVGFDYNDLFVPRTNDEYQEFEGIVAKQISYPLVWLGLISSNGSWNWIPGRTSNIVDFWCDGQPDNAQYPDHQCGFVISANRYNGHICWIAGDCTDKYAAVCQSSNTL